MSPASIPRKHHTVPEFYLRAFAHRQRGRHDRVWVLDLLEGQWRRQNPKKVAVETDFYAVESPPLPASAVETEVLARYEGAIAPMLRDVERQALAALARFGPHPFAAPEALVEALATFAAMMHVRSSPTRAGQRVAADQFCRALLRLFAPSEEEFERKKAEALAEGVDVRGLPYHALRRAVEGDTLKFDFDQTYYVGEMLTAWKPLTEALAAKRCSLLAAGGSAGLLITSDCPAGYYRSGASGGLAMYKVDPREPDTGVVLPISPRLALVFDPVLEPIVRRMTPREVAVTNSAVAFGGGRRLLFALTRQFPWCFPGGSVSWSFEEFVKASKLIGAESDRVHLQFVREKVDAAVNEAG